MKKYVWMAAGVLFVCFEMVKISDILTSMRMEAMLYMMHHTMNLHMKQHILEMQQ